MALHDYRCPQCGLVLRDVNVPVSVGARKGAPVCPNRCQTYEHLGPYWVYMDWIPAIRLSLFSDADARSRPSDFAKFTTPVEDPSSPTGFRDVTVSSLHDIRRLERDSEQAERNGEGRRMVWRDYSQNPSNWDTHTLGEDPSLKPSKTFVNGQPVIARRGDPVIADHGTIEG
jgi:hypothetical protein